MVSEQGIVTIELEVAYPTDHIPLWDEMLNDAHALEVELRSQGYVVTLGETHWEEV